MFVKSSVTLYLATASDIHTGYSYVWTDLTRIYIVVQTVSPEYKNIQSIGWKRKAATDWHCWYKIANVVFTFFSFQMDVLALYKRKNERNTTMEIRWQFFSFPILSLISLSNWFALLRNGSALKKYHQLHNGSGIPLIVLISMTSLYNSINSKGTMSYNRFTSKIPNWTRLQIELWAQFRNTLALGWIWGYPSLWVLPSSAASLTPASTCEVVLTSYMHRSSLTHNNYFVKSQLLLLFLSFSIFHNFLFYFIFQG